MASEAATWALRARFVFPVAGPPIADGMVAIRGDSVVAVGRDVAADRVRDLGNVAVLPGLVNAHTHLEFSNLPAPLAAPGMSLPEWIRHVVASRRAATASDQVAAVEHGLRQCLAYGTTTVGEIATTDWRHGGVWEPVVRPDVVMFHELIAPQVGLMDDALRVAERFLAAASMAGVAPALSPHAPYTVHPQLLAALVTLSRRFDVPLAMHLAESREERELLEFGSGPFVDLLTDFGAWDNRPEARGRRVLDTLEQLALAPRALVIHGNYLTDAEIQLIAAHRDSMAIVYCPRTHAFFGHAPYPLARMLAAGVPVALGTDSRASNPDLSVLAEMQFVAAQHSELSSADILALGSRAGASALGLASRVGTIEPGKRADLAVVELNESAAADPHQLVLAPAARVVQTWLGGQLAWESGNS